MPRLVVFSHKPCWPSRHSPAGFATDGGFAFQMRALSELFDSTVLLVPCSVNSNRDGEIHLSGHNLRIAPLTAPPGRGLARKIGMLWWLPRNSFRLLREAFRADVIHAPIPGDIGAFGMVLAVLLRKPLFVRHCGDWELRQTTAQRFWHWFMERFAGGRNVMLATGWAAEPPSKQIRWIFSTSLTEEEIINCGRERQLLTGQGARLITVCRLEKFKGTDRLLECLPLLLDEFPDLRQEVVGDGSESANLKKLADELGLDGRVTFHGRIDHEGVIRLLKQADLFVYPTRSDGFPKAVVEALACGLPVITTSVSALPQMIGNGAGILIEEASPQALARSVRECLCDANRYRAMSANALIAARQYSLERWRDTIGDLLAEAGAPVKQKNLPQI